ncbi:GIY-YIG nuclease family protein [Tenacibaculum agarivorans]|uniref:GIY-YIG nuclease family protein n=1 Tax=Tenacibaculum agarivorans TaxID=1908389 RepID=UPI000ABBC922|nr:GIY-YIG nuclease family protein [Tenacibaculum agarivorans]
MAEVLEATVIKAMKKGYMYILKCADDSYYVGSTVNLKLRLQQHQNGEEANHTKKRLPVKLVYFEEFTRIQDAFYREKQVQKWRRVKKEALIFGQFNTLFDLSKSYRDKDENAKMFPSRASGNFRVPQGTIKLL